MSRARVARPQDTQSTVFARPDWVLGRRARYAYSQGLAIGKSLLCSLDGMAANMGAPQRRLRRRGPNRRSVDMRSVR